jgi:hypothetical protein
MWLEPDLELAALNFRFLLPQIQFDLLSEIEGLSVNRNHCNT